jgi:hypothetical protein
MSQPDLDPAIGQLAAHQTGCLCDLHRRQVHTGLLQSLPVKRLTEGQQLHELPYSYR